MSERRSVRVALDGSLVRTLVHDGHDHMVVPVVALVGDVVVHPVNAPNPEFVPAEELAQRPSMWNGRPVVPEHPRGGYGSANEPHVTERACFGRLYNTRFEDGRLKTEAWLDVDRARKLGGLAEDVVARLGRGETVEVSVGAVVNLIEERGVSPDGTEYALRWTNVESDHLAMLPAGSEGACSVEMGCGAPRAAQAANPSTNGGSMRDSIISRVLAAIGVRSQHQQRAAEASTGGTSDTELRDYLWSALRAVEPGFEYVQDVFPDNNTVVYWVAPEGIYVCVQRTYATAEGGEVTLNDDRQEVEPVLRYEPVARSAAAAPVRASAATISRPTAASSPAGGCNCKGSGRSAQAREGVSSMADQQTQELVGRLIALGAFADTDRERLESFSEEALRGLEEKLRASPDGDDDEAEEDSESDPEPAPEPTVEQYVDSAPAEVRGALRRLLAREKEEHDSLAKALAKAQTEIDLRALMAKPTDELEQLARMLKLNRPSSSTHVGRGTAGVAAEQPVYEAPRPYTLALERKQKEAGR